MIKSKLSDKRKAELILMYVEDFENLLREERVKDLDDETFDREKITELREQRFSKTEIAKFWNFVKRAEFAINNGYILNYPKDLERFI